MSTWQTSGVLTSPIEYLKGVGPLRGDLLRKELQIFTFADLLQHFPLRHIDRTDVKNIGQITTDTDFVQCAGVVVRKELIGQKFQKRLLVTIKDATGELDLLWFQGAQYVEKTLQIGFPYLAYGKVGLFQGRRQMVHPELEPYNEVTKDGKTYLEPIYPSTEKLKVKGLSGRAIGKLTQILVQQVTPADIPENIPARLLQSLRLMPRYQAFICMHTPPDVAHFEQAVRRLKFEELFLAQIRLQLNKLGRHRNSQGPIFGTVGTVFHTFYNHHLPFQLTNAQKRVIKEIRLDCATGKQMNRLVQGDVGSGKTMVALCAMLIAADNDYQSCLLAPTEILAQQHFQTIQQLLQNLPVTVHLLTGSTKTAERRKIYSNLADGTCQIVIGTHAILEDKVQFKKLGFAVIDEQHRFGVAQRAKLWSKAELTPHVLVMTATPIPRTLAMTAYGDLDYSVIDELPPGRLPVETVHRYDVDRGNVLHFVKSQIDIGRQAYIIFPLIEESEKLSYEDLQRGYENVKGYFPEPQYWISMVHGRQAADVKETNMRRFVNKETQVMVSTTVIEVGVNVPNATVMVIENAEKFGLSQLHQLRGRVGRGSDKSYCILLTSSKVSNDARERLKTMCATNDGFKIAEKDLELRGPGDIEGTRQSGELNFKLASLVDDRAIVEAAKNAASDILNQDEYLTSKENEPLKKYLVQYAGKTEWSKIS